MANARTIFEKAAESALGDLAKASGWKKSKNAIFCASGDLFYCVHLWVSLNPGGSRVSLEAKPMALDPLLWEILGMPENLKEPLSLRAWGAFTCRGPSFAEQSVERAGDAPEALAAACVAFATDRKEWFLQELKRTSYTDMVRSHPNHAARGAYAVTLVVSMIADGDLEGAQALASAYAAGKHPTVSSISSQGKDFHQYAVEWIDRKRRG